MWLAVEVVINDTGLLHQKRNSWLDPSCGWEIAFADWCKDTLVRVQMEPENDPCPDALKPCKAGGKHNRARWSKFAKGASICNLSRYQGFVRRLVGHKFCSHQKAICYRVQPEAWLAAGIFRYFGSVAMV